MFLHESSCSSLSYFVLGLAPSSSLDINYLLIPQMEHRFWASVGDQEVEGARITGSYFWTFNSCRR